MENSVQHRVAILGGGMGGLAAAWHLVKHGGGKVKVTVYQRDGLLGGKGSSTRNGEGGNGQRIEEHGIHILMGWYDETIHLLREAYAAVGRLNDAKLGELLPWEKVLLPEKRAVMAEWPELTGGDWDFWTVEFPQRAGTPGVDKGLPGGVPSAIAKGVDWLAAFHRRVRELVEVKDEAPPALFAAFGVRPDAPVLPKNPEIERTPSEAEGILNQLDASAGTLDSLLGELDADCLNLATQYDRLKKLKELDRDWQRDARRALTALWFAKAMVSGLLSEKVRVRRDFDKLDDQEFRAWLEKHGRMAVLPKGLRSDSPIVRILYDLSFGHGLSFAAGVWAYAVLLFAFAYKGDYVYKMNGGMGDIVFAPLFLALDKLGVEFKFHHAVTRLEVTGDVISAIHLKKGASEGLEPSLVGVDTPSHGKVPCWPAQVPHALVEAEKPLQLGRDFDSVVLAIGVGGLGAITEDLRTASLRFREMLENAGTTGTMAAQIWTKGVSWAHAALVAGFVRPFNSCVEMSHVLASEPWGTAGGAEKPDTCIYLCDQAPDRTTHGDVRLRLRAFLEQSTIEKLLPHFTFDALVDPRGRSGVDRVDAQYYRANVEGSDRYVVTPPGSTKYRLSAGASGFSNLALAGDWVTTDINAGCVEAAARAGLQAGQAVLSWARPNRYVDSVVDWVRPQPLSFRDASMYLLPLKADRRRLGALCEQLVAEPSEGRVQLTPLFSGLLMVFASIPDGRPASEPGTGFLRQNECAFFLPVRIQSGASFRYAALVPLAYINHPVAAIAGREIYGFPKFPAADVVIQNTEFRVVASALDRFANDSEASPRTILSVSRGSTNVAALAPDFDKATSHIFEQVSTELGDPPLQLDPGALRSMNVLFLKQFRDVVDPYAAALKQVVRAPVMVDVFRSAKVLNGPFTVELPKLARPDVAAFLGLQPSVVVSKAFEVKLDFTFQSGSVL